VAAKSNAKGSKLYIVSDPSADAANRMMKAVEGEGLPRLRSPFEFGNLFITLNVEFPPSIPAAALPELLKLLPPPKHVVKVKEDDEDVEVALSSTSLIWMSGQPHTLIIIPALSPGGQPYGH
jgi:DnaJ family protein A protein 2